MNEFSPNYEMEVHALKRPREKEPKHLAAIRQVQCVRCGSYPPNEAAHIRLVNLDWSQRSGMRTGAGGGEKPFDCWVLPLCDKCHRTGPDAEHVVGTRKFYRDWSADAHAVAYALWLVSPDVDAMRRIALDVLHFGKFTTATEA